MALVAALVAAADVVDHGLGIFAFPLEGGDQSILGRHRHALRFAGDVQSDREFERHGDISLRTGRMLLHSAATSSSRASPTSARHLARLSPSGSTSAAVLVLAIASTPRAAAIVPARTGRITLV